MRLSSFMPLSLTLTLLAVSTPAFDATKQAGAQDTAKPKAKAKRAPNPDLAQVEDRPGLPRVLLIGHSTSMGYTLPVREALAAKANVHPPPANCGPTSRGVEMIDSWLGDGRWD